MKHSGSYISRVTSIVSFTAVLTVTGAITSGCSGTSSSNSAASRDPAFKDVSISSCKTAGNSFKGPEADLTVKNHSDKASSYAIGVTFTSKDGKQAPDAADAYIPLLKPGQSAKTTANSLNTAMAKQPFNCKIETVTRLPV